MSVPRGNVCSGNREQKVPGHLAMQGPLRAGDRRDCARGRIGFLTGQIDTRVVGGGRGPRWASPTGLHFTGDRGGRHLPGPPPASPHQGRDTRRAERPITRNSSAGTRLRAMRAQGQASRAARRLRPAAPQGTPACRRAASLPDRPRK